MKTRHVLTRVLFAVAAAVSLTHCGSSGSNNNQTAQNSGYYVSNGNCYNSANQIVGTAASCPVNGVNGCGINGVNGVNGYNNGVNGYNNGVNGYNNGYNNGVNGYNNGVNGYNNGVNGFNNGAQNCGVNGGLQNGQNGQYGQYGNSCIGNYVYIGQAGQMQPVVCQGQCHGVTLYTYPAYQQVYCQ